MEDVGEKRVALIYFSVFEKWQTKISNSLEIPHPGYFFAWIPQNPCFGKLSNLAILGLHSRKPSWKLQKWRLGKGFSFSKCTFLGSSPLFSGGYVSMAKFHPGVTLNTSKFQAVSLSLGDHGIATNEET